MYRITWTNLPLDQDRYSIADFTNPASMSRHLYQSFLAAYHILDSPRKIPGSLERNGEPTITYQDYYKVRLGLTYGSLKDNSSNKALFDDLEPHALEMARRLNVVNSGILESHPITS